MLFGTLIFIGLQSNVLTHKVPELKLHHVDIQRAVKLVCREADAPYSLPPDMGGEVDVVLKENTLGESLKALLKPWGYSFQYGTKGIDIVATSTNHPCPTPCQWTNADAKQVMAHLLESDDKDYWISPNITKKITFRRTTQTFEESFREALSLAGATYRRDDSLYLIYPADEKLPPFQQSKTPPEGIMDGTIQYVRYHDGDLREIIRVLLKEVGYDYSMQSDVKGKVFLKVRRLTPEFILECCLLDNGATFERRGNTLIITSIKP